tara:strand:+ start:446 stop:667 length:222 start_codon:yes stop_codon:yes gene_type:complete
MEDIRQMNMEILNVAYLQEGLWLDILEITELRKAVDKISELILQIAPMPDNDQNTTARVIGQILVNRFPYYED